MYRYLQRYITALIHTEKKQPQRSTIASLVILGVFTLISGCDNDKDHLNRYPNVESPTLETSPTGMHGFPFQSTALDLSDYGYIEEEFLVSGTAQSYSATTALEVNGLWQVEANPGVTADYTTRAMVRRPQSARDFNGTVIVEWLNVSGGVDAAPDWSYSHVELLRRGYIWVGITAQYVGAQGLINWETGAEDRYATINHPGDSFSYDIYSQAAKGIIAPKHGELAALGSLSSRVNKVIAIGESQSAFRLLTYYNAIQQLANLFDGFIIHSFGAGAALSESGATSNLGQGVTPAPIGVPATPDIPVPPNALVRTDLDTPVLAVNTETDIVLLGAAFSVHNQPDSDTFRIWEFAGLAHADQYLINTQTPDAEKSEVGLPIICGGSPINSAPHQYAIRSAISAMNTWLVDDTPPAIGDRLVVDIDFSTFAATLQRNSLTGIAINGIRLPTIEVPTATQTGVRPASALAANPFCVLFGASDPWNSDADLWDGQSESDPSPTPEPDLSVMYVDEADYVQQITAAADNLMTQGFILSEDRDEIVENAKAVVFP